METSPDVPAVTSAILLEITYPPDPNNMTIEKEKKRL